MLFISSDSTLSSQILILALAGLCEGVIAVEACERVFDLALIAQLSSPWGSKRADSEIICV